MLENSGAYSVNPLDATTKSELGSDLKMSTLLYTKSKYVTSD